MEIVDILNTLEVHTHPHTQECPGCSVMQMMAR